MVEGRPNSVNIDPPDLNQFYTVLDGFLMFCVEKSKTTSLSDKEKEGLSQKDIAEKENELRNTAKKVEENRKNFLAAYDAMCSTILEKGIPYLSMYVDAFKKLYSEKKDSKHDIKAMLVQGKSLRLFKEARSSIVDLYPVLVNVNNTFPVDDYSELSLSPEAALYGSEVDKKQKSSTKRAPMDNEEYQAMLDMFLQVKDYERFEKWIIALLMFTPDKLMDCFRDKYTPEREVLKEWAYRQIVSQESYRRAVVDRLIKKQLLRTLVDAYVDKPKLETQLADLGTEIKKLQEVNAQEKLQHEERRLKQYESIQQKDAEIAGLRNRVREFDRIQEKLNSYIDRYQAQVSMNERITNENDRRVQEIETERDCMQYELKEAKDRLDALQTDHAALQSDYNLRGIELQRLRDMMATKENTSRTDAMHELISGINEQLYYLTMFYLELKDTGKLESETIELYADTLNNIDQVLADMGIKKIGVIDQIVNYDSSIHVSADAKLSNGDKVIVSGYGWKIGDEVYIKAPVEKGAQ